LIANLDVLSSVVAVVGTPVSLGIASALYAGFEVGERSPIGEAATILCRGNADRLGISYQTFELVEVFFAELAKRGSEF